MLPVFDLSAKDGREQFEQRLSRLQATASLSGEHAQTVAGILEEVRTHGDEALVRYMRKWTDPAFDASRIVVDGEEIAAAERGLDPKLRGALERAIEHVREYQQHVMPGPVKPVTIGGCEMGLRFTPVDSAGLCVPGGTAVLFSTLVMLAVPAQVAGVAPPSISVISPPPTRSGDEPAGDISPLVLGTCGMLGVERVYRVGGAQGVAALAYGTESVQQTDMIAGPGNIFVQLAKAMVSGATGTDNGFYGPSEIVTIADGSASPARVASDLLAQAEHNPGKCFLVAWEREVIDAIADEVAKQLAERGRADAIRASLDTESCAVLTASRDQAVEIANTLAPEHMNLAVEDPAGVMDEIRHAGEVFLGDATPVAAGDYYAGPSHCLPTGTTARFTSGISVYTFLKRIGTVSYGEQMPRQAIDDVALLAEAEGLDAHAESARRRG